MSFFKDFKADFTQAVNELIPDSEEMTSEYDDEDMVNTFDDAQPTESERKKPKKKSKFFSAFTGDNETEDAVEEDFEIAPEDLIDDIDEATEPEEAVPTDSVLTSEQETLNQQEPEQEQSGQEDAKQEALEQEEVGQADLSEESGVQMSFDFLANAMEVTEAMEEPTTPIAEESVEAEEELDDSYYEHEAEQTDETDHSLELSEEEKGMLDSDEFSAEEDELYVDTFSQTETTAADDTLEDELNEPEQASESEQPSELSDTSQAFQTAESKDASEPEQVEQDTVDLESDEPDGNGIDDKEDTVMVNVAEEKPVEDVSVSEEADAATTYITKGTKITGDIETEGSIDIIGTVVGNVKCKGKLVLGGSVQGNVSAAEVYANAARIDGDVECEGSAKIGVGSVVVGKVMGTSAVIAGAVNGDIDVHGPVIVDSTAVIMGNIKSRSVQINNGAVIEGFCSQCYSEIDVKSFFA